MNDVDFDRESRLISAVESLHDRQIQALETLKCYLSASEFKHVEEQIEYNTLRLLEQGGKKEEAEP